MSALSPDQTVSLCLAPLLLFYCLFVRNKVDWKYALQGNDARRIMDKVEPGDKKTQREEILIYCYKFAVNRLKTNTFFANVPLKL